MYFKLKFMESKNSRPYLFIHVRTIDDKWRPNTLITLYQFNDLEYCMPKC